MPYHLPSRAARHLFLGAAFFLAACAPPQPSSPRPTAATIIEITPAPTQDIDATATAYAVRLVPTPTPAGLYVVQPNDTLRCSNPRSRKLATWVSTIGATCAHSASVKSLG